MNSVKKIFFLANIRLPTEKAHGLQIMKTCEALKAQDVDIELVIPERRNIITEDTFAFYRISHRFTITRVWCWDLISSNRFGRIGFWLESITFFVSLYSFLQKQSKDTVLYTRDGIIAFLLSLVGKSFVYEMHTVPQHINILIRFMLRRAKHIITISQGIRTELIREGIVSDHIRVIPDAVDVQQFTITMSQSECRRAVGIEEKGNVVVYTGHLYSWKGAQTLAEAAKRLSGIDVYLVGGTEHDIVSFKQTYGNVSNLHIMGWMPHDRMPAWLGAADVLVLPNSAKQNIGALYTSPLKLFEYMCSGRPMVVSDVPALREIVDESVSTFFTPDDPVSLGHAIEQVFKNSAEATEKAARARSLVEQYSWDNRAREMLRVLGT